MFFTGMSTPGLRSNSATSGGHRPAREDRFLPSIGLAILLTLSGCGSASTEEQRGGTLVLGMIADIQRLDPHRQTGNPTNQVLSVITESLIELDKNGEVSPGLAESWTVSDDAIEHTFFLRRGVMFHNGRELVADDVKKSYDHIIDPATQSPKRGNFNMVKQIEVVDRYTVRFHLKVPYAAFGANYFGGNAPIIPPETFGTNQPVGTGPFEFVEWKPRQYLRVRRFHNYWKKDLPLAQELIFRPVVDDTVRYTALLAGDLDFAFSLPFSIVPELLGNPPRGITLAIKPGSRALYLNFQTQQGPLKDPRVRQAIGHALDKEAIMLGVCWGLSRPEAQPYTPGSKWYVADLEDPYRRPDLERARALLEEAGYSGGLQLSAIVRNETPILNLATWIQAQLKAIDIDVDLEIMDRATHIARERTHNFELNPGHIGVYPDPDQVLYTYNHSSSPSNWGQYNNPDFDKLVEQARGTVETGKRKDLYREALEIMNQDPHFIFLGHLPVTQAWGSHVRGLTTNIRGDIAYQGGGIALAWAER